MIETGNNDREIGTAGEISRYQIHPLVWKSYSKSMDYWDPEVSLQVARQHWGRLAAYFKEKPAANRMISTCTSFGTRVTVITPQRLLANPDFTGRSGPRPAVRESGKPQELIFRGFLARSVLKLAP